MNLKSGTVKSLSLLVLGLLLAGCEERREADVPPPAQPETRTETEHPAGDQVEDAGITAAVKSALIASPQVGAMSIDVDTRAGVVTLTGAVDTLEAKEAAVRIARDVDGVREVVDQLVVKEPAAR